MNEDKIRELAYFKWEAAGKPSGQSERFWEEARSELDQNQLKKSKKIQIPLVRKIHFYPELLVAKYPKIRSVSETDTEIIIEGHEGVFSVDEERFSKSEHWVHVPDWNDENDNYILIYKK